MYLGSRSPKKTDNFVTFYDNSQAHVAQNPANRTASSSVCPYLFVDRRHGLGHELFFLFPGRFHIVSKVIAMIGTQG